MNAWALLYDELYGDDKMSDDNRVTPQESDEYDPKLKPDLEDSDWNDPVISSGDSINIDVPNFDYSTFAQIVRYSADLRPRKLGLRSRGSPDKCILSRNKELVALDKCVRYPSLAIQRHLWHGYRRDEQAGSDQGQQGQCRDQGW